MDYFKRLLKNHETLEIKFRFVGPIFKGNTGFFNHTEAYACGMKIDNVLIPKAKAKKIEVESKKVGEDKAYKWTSFGADGYTIEETSKENVGTKITLYIKKLKTD